ncbi:MAG: hypothetical protein PF447_13955, partial [Spirochaetaceae bacterium]|nr:hypothetical protein [Spirochaetaceae bacterium]
YNNDTDDGHHITSMVGAWLSVVQGFGGMTFNGDSLSFSPSIPEQWQAYSFKILYRGAMLRVSIKHGSCEITNESHGDVEFSLGEKKFLLKAGKTLREIL